MAKKRDDTDVELSYFYVPEICETMMLSEEEARHALRVLRLQSGTNIRIIDGRGHLYSAVLEGTNPKNATVQNLQLIEEQQELQPSLHVVIAPTKNADRMEWMLEKLVEIGLNQLTFLITNRTIRTKVNMERMERVMIAAMKQSEKLRCTELEVLESWDDFFEQPMGTARYIAYCGAEYERKELKKCFTHGSSATYLIGPEGDFTPDEVQHAVGEGFLPVSLGRERLRSETAGLYVGMLHRILND